MSASVRVREGREEDRGSLQGFHRELYVVHRDHVLEADDVPLVDYRDYEQVLADDLAALLSDRSAIVLVAEIDGRIVGYITGRVRVEPRRVLPRRGIVEDWYVDETVRGSGVGRALFEELERRFSGRGCDVVESATWANNDGARKAHEALGFREIRVMFRKRTSDACGRQ
jgi:ribosomal protein S18 acetylase RimI-like enzyme